jgi:hypothetical protein
MYTSIEQAFDRKELCFVYDPFEGKLVLKILHKCAGGLMKQMILYRDDQKEYNNYTKFKDIDEKPLNLPEDIYPFRRLLNWHAKDVLMNMQKQKAGYWKQTILMILMI